jgi:hypothetical protein
MAGRPARVGAAAGAVWGLAAYAVLWGHTSIVVHRPFVVSVLGTVLLLPVRTVLWVIRFVEARAAGSPFDFSGNHAWVGALSALAGAAIVVVGVVGVRWAVHAFGRPGATAGPAR